MIERRQTERIEAIERDAWLDLYEAAPAAIRTALGLSHRRVDGGAQFICKAIDHLQFNRLGYLGVSSPAHPEAVDESLAAFAATPVKNWIVHVAQGAESLTGICKVRGLVPHARTWAKFARDATPAPAGSTPLNIREINAGDAKGFGMTAAAGFGMPPVVGDWLGAIVGRPHWRCFLAYDGNLPAAAGALYTDNNCGWLGIGATLPSHRKRGAQSAILAARINAAIAAGCDLLTTETGIPQPGEAGPSFANIQRAGFTIAYPRPNYCKP
jgi:hypothetical protein